MANIFFDVGVIIIMATLVGYVARLLKQPLIPAYVLAGILVGPYGFKLITDASMVKILSEAGIAFLLFIVGLELDFKRLRDVGQIASVGGTLHVAFLFLFGFVLSRILGFGSLESIYIGIIIGFSSTLVIVKLLSDKKELDTLHGRIIIGMLLMQDIIAVMILSALGSLNQFSPSFLVMSMIKGIGLFIIAMFVGKYVFSKIFKFAAKSQELLFLLSLGVCFAFSIMFYEIGLSIAVGAFVGGLVLGNLPYSFEIVGKIKPLRDFFVTIFFVSLGMEMLIDPLTLKTILSPLIILTISLIVLKIVITMGICGAFRYTKRTSFLTGFTLAQISEFSIIIVYQGRTLGHVSRDIFTLCVMLAVVTITLTSYFIKYEGTIYKHISKYLGAFESSKAKKDLEGNHQNKKFNVILIGLDRIGYGIFRTVKKLKKSILVIDFNPEIIKNLMKKGEPCMYGDIGNDELLDRINFKDSEIVISTIPDDQDNLNLIKRVKRINENVSVFVTSSMVDDALKLYDAGADYVILPHFLGGERASMLLEDVTTNINSLIQTKIEHVKELKHRKEIGHEHPKQAHN